MTFLHLTTLSAMGNMMIVFLSPQELPVSSSPLLPHWSLSTVQGVGVGLRTFREQKIPVSDAVEEAQAQNAPSPAQGATDTLEVSITRAPWEKPYVCSNDSMD